MKNKNMNEAQVANKNLARRSTTISAGLFFVISATVAILAAIALFWLTGIKSGTDTLNEYGYQELTYEGELVEYGSYYYDVYYSYDFLNEHPEEADKYEIKDILMDIRFNNELYGKYMGILWLIEIISLLLMALSLIFAVMKTGQFESDGRVRINWFDRIFVEIDIIIFIFAAIGLVFPSLLALAWLYKGDWGNSLFLDLIGHNSHANTILAWMDTTFFNHNLLSYVFEPRWVLLVLSVLIVTVIVSLDLVIFLSIVRRIKAKRFWRSTIIGAIVSSISDNIASSRSISAKVLGALIGGIALMFIAAVLAVMAFGYNAVIPLAIGAIAMIVIVCLLVPTQIGKYEKIRTGISELQRGNFTYKVPDLGNGEFGRLAHSLNSISEAQDIAIQNELKSQRLRTELISNVSHDIRTPLTAAISYIDLLKKEGLNGPRAGEYLTIISDKADRLKKLTDDLFEAAKASSGDIPVDIERLDMYAMVEQALAELDESINKNNIEVILTNKAQNTMVYADGKLLWRVIENILTNVTKYALTGTRAYMDIYETSDKVILEVKNMSREQLNISSQELLERFKRGDSSRNTEGSGLGLAIATDLTTLMGGSFDISIDGDLFKATLSLNKSDNNI